MVNWIGTFSILVKFYAIACRFRQLDKLVTENRMYCITSKIASGGVLHNGHCCSLDCICLSVYLSAKLLWRGLILNLDLHLLSYSVHAITEVSDKFLDVRACLSLCCLLI